MTDIDFIFDQNTEIIFNHLTYSVVDLDEKYVHLKYKYNANDIVPLNVNLKWNYQDIINRYRQNDIELPEPYKNISVEIFKKIIQERQRITEILLSHNRLNELEKENKKLKAKNIKYITEKRKNIKEMNQQSKILAGNLSFQKGEYDKAIVYYNKAMQFGNNDYCNEKITECEKIIKNKNSYNKLIARADELFVKKEFEKAIKVYKGTLKLFPDDKYCIDQIEKAKNNIYNELITKADQLYNNKEFKKAINVYEDTLKLFTDDRYCSCQKLIASADQLFVEKEFEEAINVYKDTLKLIPDDKYCIDQIEKALDNII